MKIEKARPEDLESILCLQYLAYQSEAELLNDDSIPPLRQTLEELKQEYENGTILKIVNEQRKIIGSVRGYHKENTLFIGKLMVHPDYRGQGLGTRLLMFIENLFPKCRYELFTSDKSLKNLNLYRRMGYAEFKKAKINDQLSLIFLEKQ